MPAHFLFLVADMAQSLPPEDDLPPVLLFIVLCFFAACLVIVGIGIVIGLVCVAGAAVLVALGIVSSSALVAIWQRRFSAGLRALHYQVCAAAALPAGFVFSGWAPHFSRFICATGISCSRARWPELPLAS